MTATDEQKTETKTLNEADSESILRVNNLRKEYGDDDAVCAVDSVSFTVCQGEVVGLLGPNGAGKTTTIKSCLGVVAPTNGTVRVAGIDPQENPQEVYRYASAVLEGARNVYWRLTVRENLRFFTGLQGIHPDKRIDEHNRLLELVGLTEKADEVVRNLSRGMKQKTSFACALARSTPFLFLDEPTLGLDVKAARRLCSEIARLATEENRAIVLSSHDMDTVHRVCDRVIIMNDGTVVTNNTVNALTDLFRTQAYQIRFVDTGSTQGSLNHFNPTWDGDTVEVVLPNREALYELMVTLRRADAVVKSMNSIEPNLEEIFLEVTGLVEGTARHEDEQVSSKEAQA